MEGREQEEWSMWWECYLQIKSANSWCAGPPEAECYTGTRLLKTCNTAERILIPLDSKWDSAGAHGNYLRNN